MIARSILPFAASLVVVGLLAGCGSLKVASTGADAGADATTTPGDDAGAVAASDGGVTVTVETIADGRDHLGARATVGFRPWRSGLAVHDGKVYWVESGAQAGLYAAPTSGCSGKSCVTTIASMTRASAFAAEPTGVVVADVTSIERFAFAGGGAVPVASDTQEIVNLASDGSNVFWTSGDDQSIRRTTKAAATDTIIYSNGTPVGMAVAGAEVFWAGVDISGQLGALQTIGTDGKGAHEVSRFSSGFHAMGGHPSYLFYAKDSSPGSVHRLTVASNRDESVATDAVAVTDFAADDRYVYWTEAGDGPDYADGRVRRAAHDAKEPETLAVSIGRPVAIAIDAGHVYVASAGTSAAKWTDGKILKLTLGE